MPAKSLELQHTIRLIRELDREIDEIEEQIQSIMDELHSPITTIQMCIRDSLWAGTQSACGTLLGQPQAVRLALPLKLGLLKIVVDVLAAQRKQFVNIQLALADALREYRAQLVQVCLFYVHGKSVKYIRHLFVPPELLL